MSRHDNHGQSRSIDFNGQPETRKKRRAAPETAVALARIASPARSEPGGDGKRDCMRGEWCSGYEIVTADGKSRRVPGRAYQPFCPKDRSRIEISIEQMPAQFVHLAAEIGNPVKNGRMIRMPFGPRIPIRIDIDTLMRAIVESLSSWHERIADADSLTYPLAALSRSQRQMIAVRDAERVLVHRVDPLLALGKQPMGRTRKVITERDPKGRGSEDTLEFEELDGADAGMEIFTLRYLSRAVLGETKAKPEKLLGVPCRVEDCDKLALRRAELPSSPDAPVWWSECAACGNRLTETEYREWVALCAAYERNRRKVPVLENLPSVA
jgi:hypothetical protein